jgi:hypothetical protein
MNFKFIETIFEVSPYRSSILKNIDNNFRELKIDNKDSAAKKELVKNLKKFTKIKNIILSIKKNYGNAAIIPFYNRALSLDLINLFKKYDSNGDIKSLDVAEESNKYISKVYIIIGSDIIDRFSARELTAILLHELGHCFTYTSNIPRILLIIFENCVNVIGKIISIPFFKFFTALTYPAYLSLLLLIIFSARSLTFLEHKSEYKADQFAAKYGYGDEIVKVLYKFHNIEEDIKIKHSWFKKILLFFNNLITISTHPTSSSRIKELNKELIHDYKKMYPKLSNELNIILSDISIT